jgi:hypothetical protein
LVVAFVIAVRPWRSWTTSVRWLSGVLLVVVVLGCFSWIWDLGSTEAINRWAQWLVPVACLFLGLAKGRAAWPAWAWVFEVYAVGIGLYQLFALIFPVAEPQVTSDTWSFYESRVLSAPLALVMVSGMIFAATDQRSNVRTRAVVSGFLGVSVVIAQHRSVWTALLVSVILLVARYLRGRETRSWQSAPVGPVAALGFLVLAALLPLVTSWSILPTESRETAVSHLPESFRATTTLEWRIDIWMSHFQAQRSIPQWLFGGMVGPTSTWGPDSVVKSPAFTSHNMYVDLTSMLGLVAFGSVIGLLLVALARRYVLQPAQIFIWASLPFGMFYQWPPFVWAVLGAGVAMANFREISPEPYPAPSAT